MQNVLTFESNRYAIKIDNFEGPLDLLCHLIDKNKMDIYDINISEITDQYVTYIEKMEEFNLDITSEFLIMASTLIYIKSKGLLPSEVDDEKEITKEELIRRIIEYKKYKEICKQLKENYAEFSNRMFRLPEIIELPKQRLDKTYDTTILPKLYKKLLESNEQKINQNAKNIEQIVIPEIYTVSSKVKEIFRELLKKPRIVFNKLFSIDRCNSAEVVTAFTGLLELSRRNKVTATQEKLFGDIIVEKTNRKK